MYMIYKLLKNKYIINKVRPSDWRSHTCSKGELLYILYQNFLIKLKKRFFSSFIYIIGKSC